MHRHVTDKQDKQCHQMLPIDQDEKVLAIYRHHPMAYIIPALGAVLVITIVLGLAILLTSDTSLGGNPIIPESYQQVVFNFAFVLAIGSLVFTFIPIWLRLQEYIVLTDEAILQVLQPGLFASKVSQTSLERLADVSVREDFLGTLFGYGKLTVETPGEQDNYDYRYLPDSRSAAREIIEAQEHYMAALEGGILSAGPHHRSQSAAQGVQPQNISVDPAQYQAFLHFQEMQAQAAKEQQNTTPRQ